MSVDKKHYNSVRFSSDILYCITIAGESKGRKKKRGQGTTGSAPVDQYPMEMSEMYDTHTLDTRGKGNEHHHHHHTTDC